MFENSERSQFNLVSAAAVCAGVAALAYAFLAHRFLMLFVPAASIWLLAVLALQARWRPGDVMVPGRKRMFRGIVSALGLIIFLSAWTSSRPSIRPCD